MTSHQKIVALLILFAIDLVSADPADIAQYIGYCMAGFAFVMFVIILCAAIISVCFGSDLRGWQIHAGKFWFDWFKFK